MNLMYINELPSNSVIYVSMYRGYTNVYSLYKSISLSNVLVFLLTRVRYVYARVQLVTRAHNTHNHNHNHVRSQTYNTPRTRAHKHTSLSVRYVQSTKQTCSTTHTQRPLKHTLTTRTVCLCTSSTRTNSNQTTNK